MESQDNELTEDVLAFGHDAWVYCNQHLRAHQTGWCSVAARDKIGLGVTTAEAALAKCREWGFVLAYDSPPLACYTPEELGSLIRRD